MNFKIPGFWRNAYTIGRMQKRQNSKQDVEILGAKPPAWTVQGGQCSSATATIGHELSSTAWNGHRTWAQRLIHKSQIPIQFDILESFTS